MTYITQLEDELTMRKARTNRLRAMVDDIVTSKKQSSSQAVLSSDLHDNNYYYQPHRYLFSPVSPGKSSHRSSSESSSDSDIESLIDLLCSPSPSKKRKGS